VDIRDDDYAAMLAKVDAQMPRDDIATELGVDEKVLDEIASGYVPEKEVADRLRTLAADDPGDGGSSGWSMSRRSVVVVVAVDLVVTAIVLGIVFLR
jgi:hypothetical protein